MADYNSSRTGSQIDEISQINNKTFLNVMSGVTPSATAGNSTIPTIGWVITSNSWGSNKNIPIINGGTGADTVGGALQNLRVHPIGYIFEWSNIKTDGTAISNAPDLTTPTKVAQYFGYGTWELYGVGRVTVGQDVNDENFDTIGEKGGESAHTLTTTEMPSHTHSYSYADRSRFEESGSGTGHYQVSGYSTKVTTAIGGSQPHNNLQPYIVVYRWQRIA